MARVEKRVRGGKAATFGEGLGAGLSQGFSLNTVDMIDSGLFAALRQLAGDERDFREIYTEILDRKLKRWKAAKNAQPVATLTGEMVGSLALPGGPVVQGVRGGRVLNRIVSSPTGQAATAGFFGAEGDLSDKLTQGAVAAAATNVFNRTAGAVYARLGSPQQRSNQGPDGRFRERLLEESSPRSVVEAGQNVGVQVPATRLAFAPPVRALGRFAERAPGLGNIATVAGRMPSTDEAQRAARTRLNGARLLTPINAAAMAFDPFVQMSGAFAAGRIGLSVADVLARPVTAQQAANWSRAYARFIQGPSPRTQRALTSASSAFSSKLANEFGNSGGFESVTRALMGQSDTPERKE